MSATELSPTPPRALLGAAPSVRLARACVTLLLWGGIGVLAGLLLVLTVPRALDHPTLTVLTGSMEPELAAGDIVIESTIAPLEAKVGDVVTFRDPEHPERLITHRVRRMRAIGSEVSFTTKGDANNTVEDWRVARDGTMGRVEYRLPKVGYVMNWISGRQGRLLLVVVPALLLGLFELKRIWFSDGEGEAHATS